MFSIRTVPITVGADEYRFTASMPSTELTLWRRSRVRWTGRIDRIRQRQVDDTEPTHYLLMLHAAVRRFDDDLSLKSEAALTALDMRLAALASEAHAHPGASQDEPSEHELAQLEGRRRQEWAAQVRASRRANAERASALGRSHAASAERDRLSALRTGLLAEVATARRLCADAYEAYAALYTKSRSGLLGRRPSAAPSIPRYRPAPELPTTRSGAQDVGQVAERGTGSPGTALSDRDAG
ncbi:MULTISPECIES: hypothetical protein [unclassified Rathayibacter]|uniref:hypothetical protein n=1 Tax=unclassified Rathayibacter TaxID=2609250 RepID=UPI0006F8654C|nr:MULTISPECIES: hypothetical protein [unclassified Rathayibacter]KQQ06116.1 hypothetical protein ASF42_06250 [Rathayibacter sp. Leaf294]KQS13973.1 hypothetical protein ASG06_06260 [Rathayibacter sp. Leaf185]